METRMACGTQDALGTFDHSLKRSKDRAEAVVKHLVGNGALAATLLQPFEAGPTAPAASNQTEESRAKNRRVERVVQSSIDMPEECFKYGSRSVKAFTADPHVKSLN